MDSRDQALFAELDPVIASLGIGLVEVGVNPGGKRTKIHLVIYSDQGVTHGDCVRVTRAVGESLEESESVPEAYVLEVSSPGLDRVLKEPHEFELFRGAVVRIILAEDAPDKQLTGKVAGTRQLEEAAVVVLDDDGVESVIPWSRIARARLVPEEPGRGANGGKGS